MGTVLHLRTINQTTEPRSQTILYGKVIKVETAGKASLGWGQLSVGGEVTNRDTILRTVMLSETVRCSWGWLINGRRGYMVRAVRRLSRAHASQRTNSLPRRIVRGKGGGPPSATDRSRRSAHLSAATNARKMRTRSSKGSMCGAQRSIAPGPPEPKFYGVKST
jgi:hypothetical protein